MKMQVQRQWICCLMIAILFLTGMCVEIPHADTSFLRTKEVSATDFSSSIISAGTRVTVIEQVCTLDTFRSNITTYLSSNKGRTLVRRFLRCAALLTVVMLLSVLFYAKDGVCSALGKVESSHVTIVRYIQQTDGKK